MGSGEGAGARAFEGFMEGQRAIDEFNRRLADYRRQVAAPDPWPSTEGADAEDIRYTITLRPELDHALTTYAARHLGRGTTPAQAIDALLTEALQRHGFATR